ncbi:hypothetical protein, partial [Pseudomonas pergaminensis]
CLALHQRLTHRYRRQAGSYRGFAGFMALWVEFHFSQTSIGFWNYSGKQKQCLSPPTRPRSVAR